MEVKPVEQEIPGWLTITLIASLIQVIVLREKLLKEEALIIIQWLITITHPQKRRKWLLLWMCQITNPETKLI